MASAQEIRKVVSDYVYRKVSVSAFASSFHALFGAALRSRDEAVRQFAFDVHANLSHYSHSLLSEDELHKNLESILFPKNGLVSYSYYLIVEDASSGSVSSNPQVATIVKPNLELILA